MGHLKTENTQVVPPPAFYCINRLGLGLELGLGLGLGLGISVKEVTGCNPFHM